jgi:hypothetical protein
MLQGIEAMTMALFTRYLAWSAEQVHVFLVGVRKEIKNKNIHDYWAMYVLTITALA